MKTLHKKNLYCWSRFDEDRDIDFHSYLWVRAEGNIVFDPLPLTDHDKNHLNTLGRLSHIMITNSDHVRHAKELAYESGAVIWGPEAEKKSFPVECSKWIGEEKGLVEGLDAYRLSGSKTEGELAFVLEGDTLITGDLIRSHAGGSLCILPEGKLQNRDYSVASVKKMADIGGIQAILPGDGWPVFRNGETLLSELLASLL